MFREAIIAVTKAADWYALHPLTVEELREKNIGSSVSIRYSTVGKNMLQKKIIFNHLKTFFTW